MKKLMLLLSVVMSFSFASVFLQMDFSGLGNMGVTAPIVGYNLDDTSAIYGSFWHRDKYEMGYDETTASMNIVAQTHAKIGYRQQLAKKGKITSYIAGEYSLSINDGAPPVKGNNPATISAILGGYLPVLDGAVDLHIYTKIASIETGVDAAGDNRQGTTLGRNPTSTTGVAISIPLM